MNLDIKDIISKGNTVFTVDPAFCENYDNAFYEVYDHISIIADMKKEKVFIVSLLGHGSHEEPVSHSAIGHDAFFKWKDNFVKRHREDVNFKRPSMNIKECLNEFCTLEDEVERFGIEKLNMFILYSSYNPRYYEEYEIMYKMFAYFINKFLSNPKIRIFFLLPGNSVEYLKDSCLQQIKRFNNMVHYLSDSGDYLNFDNNERLIKDRNFNLSYTSHVMGSAAFRFSMEIRKLALNFITGEINKDEFLISLKRFVEDPMFKYVRTSFRKVRRFLYRPEIDIRKLGRIFYFEIDSVVIKISEQEWQEIYHENNYSLKRNFLPKDMKKIYFCLEDSLKIVGSIDEFTEFSFEDGIFSFEDFSPLDEDAFEISKLPGFKDFDSFLELKDNLKLARILNEKVV